MRKRLIILLTGALAVLGTSAGDLDKAKQRMADRLPAVNRAKTEGHLGENNRGYLEVLRKDAGVTALADAENADRQKVYESIARDAKTDADAVGRQRARQIADRSRAGIMLQTADGTWYAKGD